MKNKLMKINFPAILTLILGLGLMNGSFAQRTALAGKIDTIPAIKISGLENQTGLYLHVLYAVGQLGFIDLSRNPELFLIRSQSQKIQITQNSVIVPPVQIEKTPGRGSYNMIVFAVSALPEIKWENYSQNPNPTSYKYLGLVFKTEVDQFVSQSGEGIALQLRF